MNGRNGMVVFLAAFFGLVAISSGAINVTEELNRLQTHYKNMRPSQELIGSFLDQLQAHCKNQKKIDVSSLNNASVCVEQYMNASQAEVDVNKAVQEGRLDDFFRTTCLKWPKVKGCLKEFFDIIDNCWTRGDKVTRIVDESVKFLCGEDNDGGRIAVFFADNGMQCLEKHGDGVKQCIGDINEFPEMPEEVDPSNLIPENLNKDEICEKMEQIAGCASKELKKCDDTTPENLITSMLHFSASKVGCKLKVQQTSAVKSTSGASSGTEALIGWILTSVAAGFLL